MADQIEFYNRYSRKIEKEEIFGEKFLRLLYNSPVGKLATKCLFKRKLFSVLWGRLMRQRYSQKYILPFVKKYRIDTEILEKKVTEFRTFDEFFSRKIRLSARPIVNTPESVVFPCDGRHLLISDCKHLPNFFVKGQQFSLHSLILNSELEKEFADGPVVISRLSPVDYHRFHFPCNASIRKIYKINGDYKSVSPLATMRNIQIFFENKRIISVLNSPEIGPFLMVEVGATCVGSITQTAKVGVLYNKGDEKGFFSFGGSTVLTIFQKDKIDFSQDFKQMSSNGIEMFALMGDDMGKKI